MRNVLIILLFISFIASLVFAEPPNWQVPSGFEQSMSIICQVNINGLTEKDPENLVGAFIGEEIRGVNNADFFDIGDSVFVAIITVAGNFSEEFNFKLYNASEDSVMAINEVLEYRDDGYGSPVEPFIFNTENPYDLNNDRKIDVLDAQIAASMLDYPLLLDIISNLNQ